MGPGNRGVLLLSMPFMDPRFPLPCPDHSGFLRDLAAWCPHWAGETKLTVELSRGCWWVAHSRCLFCSVNNQEFRYSVKSPRKAVAELRALTENSPVKSVP